MSIALLNDAGESPAVALEGPFVFGGRKPVPYVNARHFCLPETMKRA
jgi:hypothetical protein